jgi:hypothetical protein
MPVLLWSMLAMMKVIYRPLPIRYGIELFVRV